MPTWIERKARKLLIAGALSLAVGLPTLACSGSGDIELPTGGSQAAEKLKGTWQVKPHQDDMRELKVINLAMRPNSDLEMLKKNLEPPPTPDEERLFEEVKKKNKNDPELKAIQEFIKMMKGATLVVDDTKWVYTIADEKTDMTYVIDSSTDTTLNITLTTPNGIEKHALTFTDDNTVDVVISEPVQQRLVFKRK